MKQAITRLPALCIILMAGSILVFQPGGLFRFVWIKLVVVIIAVLAGLLSPLRARIPWAVQAATAACVVWIAVAMLLSDTPLASMAGRWPRYEGMLTLGVYVAVFAVGAKVLGGASAGQRRKLLSMSLAAAALVLLPIAVLESAGLRPLGGAADVRPGATLGNATDQGLVGFVIAGVLSAGGSSERGWQMWLRRAGLFAAAGVAILSGSRAALAGLLIVALFASYMWMRGRSWARPKIAAGAALAVAGVAVGVLLVPAARDRLLSAGTVDGRRLLWDRSLGLIGADPVFGVGPSGLVDALPAYLNQEWARSVGDSFPADSPHSWPLQALASGGVPLLLLVLVLGAVAVVAVVRRMKEAGHGADRRYLAVVLVTAAAYGLALLTHFTSIGTTALVAFLCGGLVGCEGVGFSVFRSRVSTAAGLVLVAAGLTVAVPATIAEWPMGSGAQAAAAGDADLAEQAFQQARQLRPWDSDTALLAAQAFAGPATAGDQGAARYAVDWGSLARDRTPRSQEAGTALAIGYLYSGDPGAAKNLLDDLVRDAPYSTGLYMHRGVAQFGLGRPAEAVADLQYAAALDPGLDTPWRILANIHQRLGNAEAAQAASQRADALSGR
ncbi:O-antigen ligase family protein [Arthrobacter sp. ISL-5]|uniref:O-antigen ligase family protein n=1 Tax=Arthrobacter sp. ISL-5 TaxID=2819111 RepID=UPI001BEA7049|nr:O-antigen ligase family protein [Arthrobacter sp. ISL-5]MBT2552777.1 O-antigen ligase family protein [Arthrobacter sp. ISL-5]